MWSILELRRNDGKCKVLTRRGGGGGGEGGRDGASKLEIEARQKLQNFSTNDVTHQNR